MAIDILTLALAKKMSGSSGGSVIQSDWNQSDETASDYIKNRPFYDAAEEVVLIDETITVTDSYYENSQFYYEFGRNLGLVVGNSYNVTFLGETFENVAYNGNMQFTLSSGATINIVDGYMNSFPGDGMSRPFDADIKIWSTTEETVKLDPKYLPDSAKSDWNQNDETTLDYVKNRPPLRTLPILREEEWYIYVSLADMEPHVRYIVNGIKVYNFVLVCDDGTEAKLFSIGGGNAFVWHTGIAPQLTLMRCDNYEIIAKYTDLSTASNVTITKNSNRDYLKIQNVEEFIPTKDYQPATKKYVDDAAASVQTELANTIKVTEQTLTDEQKAQVRANISKYDWRYVSALTFNGYVADSSKFYEYNERPSFNIDDALACPSAQKEGVDSLTWLSYVIDFLAKASSATSAAAYMGIIVAEFEALKANGVIDTLMCICLRDGDDTIKWHCEIGANDASGYTHYLQLTGKHDCGNGIISYNKETNNTNMSSWSVPLTKRVTSLENNVKTMSNTLTTKATTDYVDTTVSEQIKTAIPVPTTASVGQTIVVKAVDDNGKPTEWESIDPWVINSSTEGSTKKFKITVDDNGTIAATEVT